MVSMRTGLSSLLASDSLLLVFLFLFLSSEVLLTQCHNLEKKGAEEQRSKESRSNVIENNNFIKEKKWFLDWLFNPNTVVSSLKINESVVFEKCNISLSRDVPIAWSENSTFFSLAFRNFLYNIRQLPFKVSYQEKDEFLTTPFRFRFFCPIFQVWLSWVNSLFLPLSCDESGNSWCYSLKQQIRVNTSQVSNIKSFHYTAKGLAKTWPKWPSLWTWTKPSNSFSSATTRAPTTAAATTRAPTTNSSQSSMVYLPVCTAYYCSTNPGKECHFPSDAASSAEVNNIPATELISKGQCKAKPGCLLHCFRIIASGNDTSKAHNAQEYLKLLSDLWGSRLKPFVELAEKFVKANEELDTDSSKDDSDDSKDSDDSNSGSGSSSTRATAKKRKLFELVKRLREVHFLRNNKQQKRGTTLIYYDDSDCSNSSTCDRCSSKSNGRPCRDEDFCCLCVVLS